MINPEPLFVTLIGSATGFFIGARYVGNKGASAAKSAREAAACHVFIRATNEVVSETKAERIAERTNELLEEEYSIPGNPVLEYNNDD